MRVLVAHNSYQQRGGEDAVVENECALLATEGIEVDLLRVSNDDISGLAAKLRAARDVAYDRASLALVAERIRTFRPDVLQVHNFFPRLTPAVYDAAREARVPVVQTLHNFRVACAAATFMRDGQVCELCLGRAPLPAIRHRCYRGSLAGSIAVARMIDTHRRRRTWATKVDRFFALTEFAKAKFVAAGLPAERIIVKPNFAPAPVLPGLDTGKNLRERHGALFVGRLSVEKGLPHLVEAWRHVDYPLRIAGTGPLADAIRSAAPPSVTFLGSLERDAIAAEMAAAAFLIVPSVWYEGFPMVVAEAYAAGLPVLASRIGSLAEIVAEGETGRLFAPGNPDDLIRVVHGVLADRERLAGWSEGARRAFLERYSAAAVGRILFETYRTLADGARTGRQRHPAPGGRELAHP
jgi:glycosyltransferase involved in cell wall biosynthesis